VRNTELLYWQNFARQHQNCFGEVPQPNRTFAYNVPYVIGSDDALSAATSQERYFKAIDSFTIDAETHAGGSSTSDEFSKKLKRSVSKLQRDYTPSESIVMETAIFLLGEGLLNIPDVGTVNIKQAFAFLWTAAWLQ
jgi:alpha-acetolactate decarboxylase